MSGTLPPYRLLPQKKGYLTPLSPTKAGYKSLPVESDRHFLTLVRYVERNAKRAALVKKAEDWPWSSVYARRYGNEQQRKMLSPWPVAAPRHYLQWLNASQGKEEIENIRFAIKKSRPYGSEQWVSNAVAQFGLENTMRNRGRPRKGTGPLSPQYPAHRYLCLRFACRLTTTGARLKARMESLLLSVGLFHPLQYAGLSRRALTPFSTKLPSKLP